MTLEWTSYTSPVYASSDGQLINCILTVTGMGDIPFTANPFDVEPYGAVIFAAIVANAATIPIAPFVAPSAGPPLTAKQEAVSLLNGSPTVNVICASTPSLSGTYAVDTASQANITAMAVVINGGLGLPSGGTTFNYVDSKGAAHQWPANKFISFAQAVMAYIYNLSQVAGGFAASLPSTTIDIP